MYNTLNIVDIVLYKYIYYYYYLSKIIPYGKNEVVSFTAFTDCTVQMFSFIVQLYSALRIVNVVLYKFIIIININFLSQIMPHMENNK